MTGSGRSDLQVAFRWVCERQSADQLAELLEVDREEILLWDREGLPSQLETLAKERILQRRDVLARADADRKARRKRAEASIKRADDADTSRPMTTNP